MNVLQVWLLVGIPTLAASVAFFLGRSLWRAMVGYLILLGGFGVVTVLHRPSGAVFGGLIALIYAAGRGSVLEYDDPHPNEVGVPDEALLPSRRRQRGARPA